MSKVRNVPQEITLNTMSNTVPLGHLIEQSVQHAITFNKENDGNHEGGSPSWWKHLPGVRHIGRHRKQSHKPVKRSNTTRTSSTSTTVEESIFETHSIRWSVFAAFIAVGITVELVFGRTWARTLEIKDASMVLAWWLLVGAGMCGFIYLRLGSNYVADWIDGWLMEVMMTFDNLIFFAMILNSFGVPSKARNRVLLVVVSIGFFARLVMFDTLVALETGNNIVSQILGVLMACLAYHVVTMEDSINTGQKDFNENPAIEVLSNILPVTSQMDDDASFFIDGKATPSFLCVLCLCLVDFVCGVDTVVAKSKFIPDEYVALTSTGIALIMLRASFFFLDSTMHLFRYMKYSMGAILGLFALLALFPDQIPITNFEYCAVVVILTVLGMVGSVVIPNRDDVKI